MAFNANSVGVGRKNKFFLCMCSKNCNVIINIIVYIVEVVVCQNCQVIITSLWVPGMEDDSGIVIEDVCEDGMCNLGGGGGGVLVYMLMRAGILLRRWR